MNPKRQASVWAIPVYIVVVLVIPAIMRHVLPHSVTETYCEIAITLVGTTGLSIYVWRTYRAGRSR